MLAAWKCDLVAYSSNIRLGVGMQGFGIGAYDVLFATNVLHATRDMGNTLQHCKALLRKGGLLIANELSTKTEFLTLTFGITDGWWLYDDVERRIPGSPILSRFADPLLGPIPPPFARPSCHAQEGTIAEWVVCASRNDLKNEGSMPGNHLFW